MNVRVQVRAKLQHAGKRSLLIRWLRNGLNDASAWVDLQHTGKPAHGSARHNAVRIKHDHGVERDPVTFTKIGQIADLMTRVVWATPRRQSTAPDAISHGVANYP